MTREKESVSVPVAVEFLEEDGVYMVSVPWLQGCRAWGDTLDEALRAVPDTSAPCLKPVTRMVTFERSWTTPSWEVKAHNGGGGG